MHTNSIPCYMHGGIPGFNKVAVKRWKEEDGESGVKERRRGGRSCRHRTLSVKETEKRVIFASLILCDVMFCSVCHHFGDPSAVNE